MNSGIVFQVETTRVLEILAREIYDSPLALLRENVQNAYDAVRERFVHSGTLIEGGRIDIHIDQGWVSIADNGVGMSEHALRENFWKAGSSGKLSQRSRQAGVVGTFGIGAMANFGVCTNLTVETRAEGSEEILLSVAQRDSLRIAEECITLERINSQRDIGTTITAYLDDDHKITAEQALRYLDLYVSSLPVPVFLNGTNISMKDIEARLPISGRKFETLGSRTLKESLFGALFNVRADSNGQILVTVSEISLGGNDIEGSLALLQNGGPLMGMRSYFGLSPMPVIGAYQFGGFGNLSFLKPTAGREALSRESIDMATRLIGLTERAVSECVAVSSWADKNNAFLQWILLHGQYDLANNVSLHVLPEKKDVPLGNLKSYIGTRAAHYYIGTDPEILATFSNEETYLLQIAQTKPRRKVQMHYVTNILKVPQVPDSAQVTRLYMGTELTAPEASVLLRAASILRNDYLIPDVELALADISHGVTVLADKSGEELRIFIARSSSVLPPLLEFYKKAYELFAQFMKDFVRVHIYPRITNFVPSSTRDGVDALRRVLERNRELYRYEEAELGDLEGVLGEYLSGAANLTAVLQTARSKARPQTVRVSREQIGTIETEVPGITDSPVAQQAEAGSDELGPSPPIIRDLVCSEMKILRTSERYQQLNNFTMLLGLSDRLMRTEAEFFHAAHTTRIIWGGHRVIYIFTEATGRLSLYYDIELRAPIEYSKASGGMFSTTTLITKNRIFVPVPDLLEDEFKITAGYREFFVRFDILSSDIM